MSDPVEHLIDQAARVAEQAVAEERERCARVAENWRTPYGGPRDVEVAQYIAAAIRKKD